MASENETFDEVLRCMQNDIVHFVGKPVKHSRDLLQEYHDRFKAAHRREVAELRECLKEAIREKCPFTRMSCKHGEPCDYECGTVKWRKALQDEGGAK